MKKNAVIILLALTALCLVIIAPAYASPYDEWAPPYLTVLTADEPAPIDIYPQAGIVTSLDYRNDIVTLTFGNGLMYQFFGTIDYALGDMVSVIMDSRNTPSVLDDVILTARYSGVAGWRWTN